MKISGLQKLTLLDFPEKDACIVFTGGCNFRCPFCHNSALLYANAPEFMSESEFFAFLDKRKGLLDGVCITGGEPLMQSDIAEFMGKIRQKGYLLKLDTNGSYPDKLAEIINARLADYIAMDIKAGRENYKNLSGTFSDISKIEKSVSLIMGSGIPYEFRTTAVSELHSDADFEDIGRLAKGASKYFIQGYKESEGVLEKRFTCPSKDTLERYKNILISCGINAFIR